MAVVQLQSINGLLGAQNLKEPLGKCRVPEEKSLNLQVKQNPLEHFLVELGVLDLGHTSKQDFLVLVERIAPELEIVLVKIAIHLPDGCLPRQFEPRQVVAHIKILVFRF